MDMLDIYTDCLICQNKHATATGLSDMVDGEFKHDKVTRFLRLSDFDSKSLWRYVKPSVRSQETADGHFFSMIPLKKSLTLMRMMSIVGTTLMPKVRL